MKRRLTIYILSLLFFTLLPGFVFTPGVFAQDTLQSVFPDANFRYAVKRDVLKDTSISDSANFSTYAKTVTSEETLDIENRNISDLTGLEKFASLKTLKAGENPFTTIPLSELSNLQVLYIPGCRIRNLTLSANSNLQTLDVSECRLLSYLDISANRQLRILNAQNCANLDSIPLRSNSSLIYLNVSDCPVQSLDLRSNPGIQGLYCKNTSSGKGRLNTLLLGSTQLRNLACENQSVTSLDLYRQSRLDYLNCENNPLIHLELNPSASISTEKIHPQQCTLTPGLDAYGNMCLTLPPSMDMGRISAVHGAQISGNTLRFPQTSLPTTVSYSYDTGNHSCIDVQITADVTADILEKKISSLSTRPTLKDAAEIAEIDALYNAISRTEQQKVSNYASFLMAKERLSEFTPDTIHHRVISSTRVELSWKYIPDTDGYRVYRSDGSASGYSLIKDIDNSRKNTFTDTSLERNTEYQYKIQAYILDGGTRCEGNFSEAYKVYIPSLTPLNLHARKTDINRVVLSWNASDDAQGYEILRKADTDSQYSVLRRTDARIPAEFEDSSVTLNHSYSYRIRSYARDRYTGKNLYSDYSAPVNVHFDFTPEPPEETLVTADYYNKTQLSISDTEGAQGIEVFRKDEGGDYTFAGYAQKRDSHYVFTDTELIPSKTYWYKVRAYYMDGENKIHSDFSIPVSATPRVAVSTPLNFTVSQSAQRLVRIDWMADENVSGYEIFRSEDGRFKRIADIPSKSAETYMDKNVFYSHQYDYKIRSYVQIDNKTHYSGFSRIYSVKINADTGVYPSIAKTEPTKVSLSWNILDGAEGYEIERYDPQTGESSHFLIYGENQHTYEDRSVRANCIYNYTVRGFWNCNASTEYGNSSTYIRVNTELKPPENFTAVRTKYNEITLSWENAFENAGYELYRSTDARHFRKIASSEDTQFTDSELEPNTSYSYKIRTVVKNSAGNEYSPYSEIRAKKTSEPGAASLRVQNTAYNEVQLEWNIETEASAYEIERSDSDEEHFSVIGATYDRSFKDIHLVEGKTYLYRVRGFNRTYLPYSDTVSVTPRIKAPDCLKIHKLSPTQVQLIWGQTQNASGYEIFRKEDSSEYSLIKRTDGNTLQFTDDSISLNHSYTYKIRAYAQDLNNNLYSGFCEEQSVNTQMDTTVYLTAQKNTSDVTIRANEINGISGYEFYRSNTLHGGYTLVYRGEKPAYTDTQTLKNQTFYYKARAFYEDGNGTHTGAFSAILIYEDNLQDITRLYVENATPVQIVLQWDRSADADFYEVYRSTEEKGNYQKLSDAFTPSYTDSNVEVNKTYFYKVRPCTQQASGNLTKPVHAATTFTAPQLSCSPYYDGQSVYISWSNVAHADGYILYRSDMYCGIYKPVYFAGKDDTCYIDTNIISYNRYYYKLAAYCNGKETVYSEYSNIVKEIGGLDSFEIFPTGEKIR